MKLNYFFLILLIPALFSCNTEGCTSPQAENFNPDAKNDDGSCYFVTNTALWFNQADAQHLIDDGAEWLTYETEFYGGYNYNYYNIQGVSTAPDCIQYGSSFPTLSTQYSSNGNSNFYSTSHVVLKDQTGFVYGEWDVQMIAGECQNFQLKNFNTK
jgi:hypothetical protein